MNMMRNPLAATALAIALVAVPIRQSGPPESLTPPPDIALLEDVEGRGWWAAMACAGCVAGGIALAFLLPIPMLHRWRNFLLVAFCCTTYPIATVMGFGWVLCILGFVQCEKSERSGRIVFLVTFIMMQIFSIPWSQVFV